MRNFNLIKRRNDPFLAEFDFGSLLDDLFKAPFKYGLALEKTPAVDVYERDSQVIVKAEVPGVRREDIKLKVDGDLLTITGEKKEEHETKKEDYYRLETSYGKFQRTLELPASVKADAAKAAFKNGVLKVELPKADIQKSKEIKIDVN